MRPAIIARSSYGTVILPAPAPRGEDELRVLRLAERAVVAPERAEVVALLLVEVAAQDPAAVDEVGPEVKQIVLRALRLARPEGHHLHVAARARARHGVLAKAALDLDHAEHELRVEARADRLEVHRAQELLPLLAVGDALLQPAVHLGDPALAVARVPDHQARHRTVPGPGSEPLAHRLGQALVLLRAGPCEGRKSERNRQPPPQRSLPRRSA